MKLRKIIALLATVLMVVSMMPLSAFAAMGGDFPWTEEENPTLVEQILERDGFIDGIWFPWFHGGTVGHNLTSNELMAEYYDVKDGKEASWLTVELDSYGADKIYREIYNLKSMGYNMLAYGGSIMAEGVVFDHNGDVIGIKQDYLDNARRLLDMCREIGMPVMWNVYFHCSSMPDYYGIDGWKVMCQMLGNREIADHYAENFVAPLCDMLAEYSDVVALVSIADEPENEINDIGMGNHFGDTIRTLYGVNQDDMVYFMQQINETVREKLPDMPRTVASNAGNKSIYRDFNLDLIGHNQYTDIPNFQTIESMVTDADMLMTEYNVGNRDTNDESYANKLIAFRQDLMEKGYKGGFQWCWMTRTSINNDYALQRSANDPTSFRKTVTLLKRYMDAYRAEYRRETITLDAPVLYANAGDGKVLWIPSEKAATITIQRSDDGGYTWKNLVSNVKQSTYVDQYLVGRYTDNTAKPNSGYCYRIIASNGSDTITSAPNNVAGTEDKFVDKDYVDPEVKDGIYYQPTTGKTKDDAKLTAIGVDKNRPAAGSFNLIENGSFESNDGQWNTDSFLRYAQVVEDPTTVDGNKSLYFNTANRSTAGWYTFTVDGLSPNTEYTFSAFIKGAYLADDNKGFGSIGVIDPDTNRFMVYWDAYKTYARGSRETQQIYPTAWDDEWHLRSVSFNSGKMTSVTIALYGYSSKMWVDGIALFESANGVKYNNGESSKAIASSQWEDLSATATNAVEDSSVNNAAYWTSGAGYKQIFMNVVDGALQYADSPDPCGVRYTKWVDVKPNTDYYYTVTVDVTSTGNGRFAILDNAKLLPYEVVVAPFSTAGVTTYRGRISTGKHHQLGLCVVDLGGVATIDDITLYEAGESEPVVTDPSFDGYIVNGDFEIGTADSWENLWNANKVSIVAGYNSRYAIQAEADQYTHMRQLVKVEPNTDYIIELWTKDARATTLLIKNGGDTVNLKQAPLPGGSNWTKVTAEFNSGDYTQIIVSLMGSENDAVYTVDNVTMRPKHVVVEDGYLVNGNFEIGTADHWENVWGSSTITIVGGHNSDHAMKVNANLYNVVRQTVSVEPNTTYVIEAWVKNCSNSVLLVKDSTDTINVLNHSLPNGTAWTKVTAEFDSGNNTTVLVGFMGGTDGATYTVDDVTMYEKQISAGVLNGGFEEGEQYWGLHSGSYAIVSDAHSGNNALRLTNPFTWGEAAVQTIAVEPNSYYVITWWYKASKGTGIYNLIAMHDSGNMQPISGNNYMSSYNGGWQQGSYMVYTDSASTMLLKFTTEVTNPGTILIDDVTVEKTDCPHQYSASCDVTCDLCGAERVVDNSWHSYYSYVAQYPTCVTNGSRIYTCWNCSASYTEEIPATGAHNYSSYVSQSPTCAETGIRTYYCSDCPASYTEIIPATGNHTYSNVCDYYCNVCSGYRSAPHSYSGSCDTTCNLCDYTRSTYYSHSYDNACDAYCNVCDTYRTVSHNYSEVHREYANCGYEGMIWYQCFKCDDMYTVTIPATGNHVMDGETIEVTPTCNRDGLKWVYCSVCQREAHQVTIPATGEHAYTYECDTRCKDCGQLTRPDATHSWAEGGCSVCREHLFNGDFELGEDYWTFNVGKHEIVTNDVHGGNNALQLSDVVDTWGEAAIQAIDVLPNTQYEISWWYKATPNTGVFNLFVMENAEGYRNLAYVSGQAFMNGYSGTWQKMTYVVNTGDATSMLLKFSTEASDPGTILIDDVSVKSQYDLCDHQYRIDSMSPPSCTGTGAIHKYCDLCGYYFAEEVPAQGHNYLLTESVDPTCDEAGKKVYVCQNNFLGFCGDTYTEIVPATGHTEVIDDFVAPTCTDTGLTEGRHCSVCDEVLIPQSVVDELGHDYEAVVTAPDCVNGGYTTYTCSACGDSYEDNIMDALGHAYVGQETNAPTCGGEGVMTYTCSRCGDAYTVAIPAIGEHTYAHDFDVDCDLCGAVRTVDTPISYTGKSVSEDVRGLAFEFKVTATGFAVQPGSLAQTDYTNVTYNGYKLLEVGVIASNDNDAITIKGERMYDVTDTYARFAFRVIEIPENGFDTIVTMTPYYVVEIGNERVTLYGESRWASYNSVLKN